MSDSGTWWATLEWTVSTAVYSEVSGYYCIGAGVLLLIEHVDLLSAGVFWVQAGHLSEEMEQEAEKDTGV